MAFWIKCVQGSYNLAFVKHISPLYQNENDKEKAVYVEITLANTVQSSLAKPFESHYGRQLISGYDNQDTIVRCTKPIIQDTAGVL